MKKVLIIAALLAGGYYLYSQNNTVDTSDNPATTSPLDKYNNQLIVDADGYWMLVKDGKLYTPVDQASLTKWSAENPNQPTALNVAESIWLNYSNDNYGGTF